MFYYDMQNPKITIGCIILASGISKRFGNENKLLMPFQGKPVIQYILQTVSQASFTKSVCVTQRTEIDSYSKQSTITSIMHNMSEKKDTIRIGLDYLLAQSPLDGVMFCVADQPFLSLKTLQYLCADFMNHPNNIIRAASYDETGLLFPGNPVIFPSSLYNELYALDEGKNGRDVIAKYSHLVRLIPIKDSQELADIDTPQSLMNLIQDNNKKALATASKDS